MGYEFAWHARSSSIDETNHIYYPKLFERLDEGIEVLLEEIEYPLHRLIPDEGYALPIVHAEADYLRPIEFGDVVTCKIKPSLGDSSIQFYSVGTVENDQVFEATIVRVFVDTDTFKKQDLPNKMRERLIQFTED